MDAKVAVVASPATVVSNDGDVDLRGQQGLLLDVKRIIAAEESNGWFVHRHNLEQLYPTLMESVCRASANDARAPCAS